MEEQAGSKNELGNSNRFSQNELQGRDNVVRIPYLKHLEISAWYSKPNEDYDWLTPRQYLRGKSWKEQYELGLEVLRKFGVLK